MSCSKHKVSDRGEQNLCLTLLLPELSVLLCHCPGLQELWTWLYWDTHRRLVPVCVDRFFQYIPLTIDLSTLHCVLHQI